MTADQAPWTVLRLLEWTREFFAGKQLASPRLCAEVLLADVLGCQRVELYARYNYQPAAEQLDQFRQNVRKAAAGEPVAYLVGQKEFYSLPIRVTPDVLIPRPETEMLVDAALEVARSLSGGAVWDVCTGSGCVACAIARQAPDTAVLATDISPRAVAIAQQNVEALGLADRMTCAEADLCHKPDAWDGPDTFDIITANPPYVADGDEVGPGVEYEPDLALRAGPEGMDVIVPLLQQIPAVLKPGGRLCLEFGFGQGDAVRDAIVATGAFAEPDIRCDHNDIERIAVVSRH